MDENRAIPGVIWIERDGECPYFYIAEELDDAAPPLARFVRSDLYPNLNAEIDRLRAENTALRERIRTLEAGIEQTAKRCDERADPDLTRFEIAARLRALLGSPTE